MEDYAKALDYRHYYRYRGLGSYTPSSMPASMKAQILEMRQKQIEALEDQYSDFKKQYDKDQGT